MENPNNYAYSNRIEVNASVYDVLISFYQASPIKDDGGQLIGENKNLNANIAMSPQHAKAFIQALQQQINWYENTFGEIDLEPKESSINKGL